MELNDNQLSINRKKVISSFEKYVFKRLIICLPMIFILTNQYSFASLDNITKEDTMSHHLGQARLHSIILFCTLKCKDTTCSRVILHKRTWSFISNRFVRHYLTTDNCSNRPETWTYWPVQNSGYYCGLQSSWMNFQTISVHTW